MGNRYVLINRIEKETNSNYAVIYDTYEYKIALFIKTYLANLLGKHKEYIPYVSIANRSYPDTTELTSLTHQLKNKHEALEIYNELEKKYSNVVSKFFSEKLLEKYIVKTSFDSYRLNLELPNEADLSLKELDTSNSCKDIYISINKYQGEELHIKNLIFPNYFTGNLKLFILWKKSIHIENLVAPSTKIEIHRILDSLGSEPSKSFVIDNIECASLINHDFYNINIKNLKINRYYNDSSFNPVIEINKRNGVTAKITIENLNINTPKIIKISENVDIKNRNQDNISDGGNNIKQNLFKDKKFVITGAISGYSNRNTIIDIIEMNGGKVSSTVNKETDYLLCEGLSNSSKSKKALQYGTKIINGDDFREMYKTSR